MNVEQNTSYDIVKTRVPLSMVDFKFTAAMVFLMIVFFVTSFIDHLYRSIWTYLSVILICGMMLTAFYLLTRYEISIYGGSIFVKKPFFREVRIPIEKINGVASYNNSVYKYRKLYFVIMVLMILALTIMNLSDSYRMIESYGIENATNIAMSLFPTILFTILLYNAYQVSRSPEYIKIDINPGEIKLYPENEQKYILLKKKLNRLLR